MPRQARLDAPGTLHHTIIRGIERRRIVDDRRDRKNFLDRLERVVSETTTSEVFSMRRRGERKLTDERILGSGEFVRVILEEADDDSKINFTAEDKKQKIEKIIESICKEEGVSIRELQSGGRREAVSRARYQVTSRLVEEHGISFAEVARNVGVTTSAIFKIMKKCENKFK